MQLRDGVVVAWGGGAYGGDISGVRGKLKQGIENVWSTRRAFVAQLRNGICDLSRIFH